MSARHATSRRTRSRPPGRVRLLAAAVLLLLGPGTAGCASLARAQHVVGGADLVNELAARLREGGSLTYAAQYRLTGRRTASIDQAQLPARSAFGYPTGRLIVTGAATTECRPAKVTVCTLTAPPGAGGIPTASLFTDPGRHGLVPPVVVAGLLATAALDPDILVEQHGTTVAGQHATCVQVSGVENATAAAFTTCVTTTGVLGRFTGTVTGTAVDLILTGYRDGVAATAFSPPTGARLIDRRPRSRETPPGAAP